MRINAGTFKGFLIRSRDIPGTRPTSDKVKQALFNILGPWIKGKSVLDLYSGFGGLGLEALSRGAKQVVFVENNTRCIRILGENLVALQAGPAATILKQDVFVAMESLAREGARFDAVLSDAPYTPPSSNAKILMELEKSDILQRGAFVVVQHHKAEPMSVVTLPSLGFLRSYRYGDTSLSVYKKES